MFDTLISKARQLGMSHIREQMVKDFIEVFPGKCMICSYHRFGREHGLTTEKEPVVHECIDN